METKTLCILSIAIMISASFVAGCMDKEDDSTSEGASKYFAVNEVVNSSNMFTFDMYRQLLNGTENIFFSPYSITIALGMAYEGANGDTASQMLDVIDLPEDDEARRDMVRSLQNLLNPGSAPYNLSTANAYWLRMGEDLNDSYQYTIENDYKADGQELDFVKDPTGSADTINQWVEGETNGKIEDLITPNMITGFTYMILTNAIYFRSDWKYQFDQDATREESFYLSDGGTVPVDMMNICDEDIDLNYSENDDAKMLHLPYKSNALSMYVILPKENDISSLEEDLTEEYLDDMKSDLTGEWVDVNLPKFKFEQKYDLIPDLEDMGMVDAFEPGLADFSGISESGRSDLIISDVIHKSFVEVNEEGTEAAAATAVGVSMPAVDPDEEKPIDFRADHPFIFLIEHEETGQILFMGKVEDPNT